MNKFTEAMCNKHRAARWAEVLRLGKSMIHYLIIQANGGRNRGGSVSPGLREGEICAVAKFSESEHR